MAASKESTSLSYMLFPDAADSWLRSRTIISRSTRYRYTCNIKYLSKCFGKMKLVEIQSSHIQHYRALRAAGEIPGLRKAGASAINHELGTLKQILDRAGEWDRLKEAYKTRIVPSRIGRKLSNEEETQLFEVAYTDTELARKLAACVVSHVSGAESIDRFLQHQVPEEVPTVWHELAEQVMLALFRGRIAVSGPVSKLIQ